MSFLEAVILGVVQGLGEFLPISSSAHLVLVPWFFGWHDPGLTFDVALHVGTLVALVAFYWKDWLLLIKEGFSRPSTSQGRLFWTLVVATVPGALFGYFLEEQAETVFREPLLIGSMLIAMGIILFIADSCSSKRKGLEQMGFGGGLWIGVSQALAIIPGVSRAGITMTAGLLLGLKRSESARFSFLLSTPIVFGAGVAHFFKITPGDLNLSFFTGVFVSAVVGFLSIKFLLDYLARHSFGIFIVYRLLLGTAVIMFALIRK
ncbi:MAG: Undecaprenyl-diphosphatase [Desulfotomaculum sp. 46_296]|nr:MAG: Undecaprenyl-diphosphatase [Desulfotomaculum sp. 46_296]HAU30773.1 UDP-diphosphatase [Desulfotomaculum sp.]